MLAYPGMIADIAKLAGIRVPRNPDGEWDPKKFLHFAAFCNTHLGRPIRWGHFRGAAEVNAKMIAAIPLDELKKMTLADVRGRCLDL